MRSILQGTTNVPQLTLVQLIVNNRIKKSKKFASNITNSKQENISQIPIDVKEPYYIDRFKSDFHHTHDQSNGKCLACGYAKLQTFTKRPANIRTHQNGNLQGLRVKTQRPSQEASFNLKQILDRKFRPSQDTSKSDMKYLAQYLGDKLRQLDKITKQNFEREVGKAVDDPSVIKFYVNILLKKQRKLRNASMPISQVVKIIESMKNNKFESLLIDKALLKQLKHRIQNEQINYRNMNKKMQSIPPSLTELAKNSKQDIELCSLKLINKDKHKQKQRDKKDKIGSSKIKSKKKNKKVRIDLAMSDESRDQFQPEQICSKYFIQENATIQLSDQVKNQLNKLARQKYRRFKGAVNSIDDFLQDKISANPDIHEKVTKKLEAATDWMKSCIPNDDFYEEQKHIELSKLMNSVRNMSKISRRRSSLKKNQKQAGIYGASKFNEGKDADHKLSRRSSSKSRKSYYSKGEQDEDYSEQQDGVSMSLSKKSITLEKSQVHQRKPRKHLQQNTQKLIMEQMNDRVLNQSQLLIDKQITNKTKNRVSKASILKYDKSRQLDDFEHLIPKQSQASTPFMFHRKPPTLVINKQQKTNNNKEVTLANTRKLIKYDESEVQPVQKQKKKKVYLKIKAAELLKQNNQLILGVQNQLRQLKLSKFIINSTDCVFTQKKKIRNIREIIKMKPYCDIEEQAINRILQYVEIYEQNCQILLEKYLETQKQKENHNSYDFAKFMDRKQIYKQLLFYDLTNDFRFGFADEQEFQFTFKVENLGKEWQISSKNIKVQNILPINRIQHKKYTQKFNDLVQVEVSQMGSRESFGIAKTVIRQSLQGLCPRSSPNTIRTPSNMYLNHA